jgi:lipopolysaccharide transport system ATP-binding protein
MSNTAIRAEHLGKQYRIGARAEPYKTVRESLQRAVTTPVRRAAGLLRTGKWAREAEGELVWALRDVSFDVKHGEVLGVIGRNGAGKSTLLKILSRITPPSVGRAEVHGRIGSLLEVGTGFHPELTGRENIYLNGAFLGMDRAYIARRMEEIVEFSGVGKFLDTPVKRYSSGMYLRLAFAVAAHLEPEILIVDEVLAVGDTAFQEKCVARMGTVAREGRTVLFVSHNMTAVHSLCTRCVVIQEGRVKFDGDTEEAILEYQTAAHGSDEDGPRGEWDYSRRSAAGIPAGKPIIRKVVLQDEMGRVTDTLPVSRPARLVIEVDGLSEYPNPVVGVLFKSYNDQNMLGFNTAMRPPVIRGRRQGREELVLEIPHVPFTPGTYWIDIGVDDAGVRRLDYVDHAVRMVVAEFDVYGSGVAIKAEHGVVYLDGGWELRPAPPADGAAVGLIEQVDSPDGVFTA